MTVFFLSVISLLLSLYFCITFWARIKLVVLVVVVVVVVVVSDQKLHIRTNVTKLFHSCRCLSPFL